MPLVGWDVFMCLSRCCSRVVFVCVLTCKCMFECEAEGCCDCVWWSGVSLLFTGLLQRGAYGTRGSALSF